MKGKRKRTSVEYRGPAPASGVVKLTIIYPGDIAFTDTEERKFSFVSVRIDGRVVQEADGAYGFQVQTESTVGVHDFRFDWTEDKYEWKLLSWGYEKVQWFRHWRYFQFALKQPGTCTLRLNKGFGVSSVEPSGAAEDPHAMRRGCTRILWVVVILGVLYWMIKQRVWSHV